MPLTISSICSGISFSIFEVDLGGIRGIQQKEEPAGWQKEFGTIRGGDNDGGDIDIKNNRRRPTQKTPRRTDDPNLKTQVPVPYPDHPPEFAKFGFVFVFFCCVYMPRPPNFSNFRKLEKTKKHKKTKRKSKSTWHKSRDIGCRLGERKFKRTTSDERRPTKGRHDRDPREQPRPLIGNRRSHVADRDSPTADVRSPKINK